MKTRATAGSTIVAAVGMACLIAATLYGASRNYGDVDHVHVDRVIDGDTFVVTVPGWPDIIGDSISIRVAGIDCAEVRSKLPDSVHMAEQATAFTRSLLAGAQEVSLRNMARSGFFRIAADVIADGINLGDTLVHVGLASRDERYFEGEFVYASRTGSSYHQKGCSYLRRSTIILTLSREDVADMGYVACSRCEP